MAASPSPLAGSLEQAVWSLAYACTGSSGQAQSARTVFEQAAGAGGHAVLFRRWWQEKTLAPLPAGAVVQPWATQVHHRIADRLEQWQLLGDEPLLLPCTGCGRVFTSKPPRYARFCGACKPYTPSGRANPDGSPLMVSAGFYPAGPYAPSRGQSVLCAHPDCFRLFLSTSSQRRYCDQHQNDRKAAARARSRSGAAKHTRRRFYPPDDSGPLQVSFGRHDGSELRITVGANGYRAQDEHELTMLLQLAQADHIHAYTTETACTSNDHVQPVLSPAEQG